MKSFFNNSIRSKSITKYLFLGVCSLFMVICANYKVYLPISVVPITLHTFAVMILGYFLPTRHALSCFFVFFIEALIGSPFFGHAIAFSSLSMGFYAGMVLAIIFLSHFRHKMNCSLILSLAVSNLMVWGLGVLYLQLYFGLQKAIMMGLVPFIIGDCLKLLAAYGFIKGLEKKAVHE